MLRAAYFAQELLSTFSTSLGEVALQPSTGGTFVVEIFFQSPPPSTASPSSSLSDPALSVQTRVLWDRKTDGGFPETKELKRRVRDVIEPGRDLGHVDKDYAASRAKGSSSSSSNTTTTIITATTTTPKNNNNNINNSGGGESGATITATRGTAPSQAEDDENTLGLNTHPGETVGGPACKPAVASARTNAATQEEEECEDCK
ncbi:Rdx family-domain-containing protein [Daldinia caldariorum]|uniref:Rdx family-domain-containing protein n=1 Tax=Daldinia caldariorum TaxID=326644 RepID=UPI002007FF7A|nr:Rdx family-domain-containing protein [Daldinia caldariorum]KAI1467238.1 Rdx family-domain-containing protein [Daldinia caldariorum]